VCAGLISTTDASVEVPVRHLYGAQADLDRELAAIAAQSEQIAPGAIGRAMLLPGQTVAQHWMRAAEALLAPGLSMDCPTSRPGPYPKNVSACVLLRTIGQLSATHHQAGGRRIDHEPDCLSLRVRRVMAD